MDDATLHGSLVFVFAWLALGGLGAPLPEDAALLTTGVLIQHGTVRPEIALPVVLVGVLVGDAGLFFAARKLGRHAYDRKTFQRILPPARRARLEDAYRRYGGRMVFFARHVGGLRAAAFAMAGISGMRPTRFFFWDGLAACLSVPLMVAIGFYGATHVQRMRAGVATTEHYIAFAATLVAVVLLIWHHVRSLRVIPPDSVSGEAIAAGAREPEPAASR
ncbi:MAG TPA: DedA family protein [Kofleriaceae bacterium]|nr:DedA family protein [Kofleriaceae bacterium]